LVISSEADEQIGLKKRKMVVLHQMPMTQSQTSRKMPKQKLMEKKDSVFNSHFLKFIDDKKLKKDQVIDIIGQIHDLGYQNVNDMFFDGYFFDTEKLEFTSENACPLKIGITRDFKANGNAKNVSLKECQRGE